jgi:ABC-type dipeptide/oligopeptide/nickel transport system permease subunit
MAETALRQAVAPISRPSPALEIWNRFRRHRLALIGATILATLLTLSLAEPLISPYDPVRQQLSSALLPPSFAHPLGADHLGRDIATRLLYGARFSLLISVLATGLGLFIGVPLGAISGYYGRWVDLLIQRLVDILLALPGILPALVLGAILGPGLLNVIVAIGVGITPLFIRLVRGSVLSIRAQPYVEAAHALGIPDRQIIRRHVLANALVPIIVQATLMLAATIPAAAGLGFLGLGVEATIPEWGAMLGEGRQYIFSAPHIALAPGLTIFVTALAFNMLGDGLREALDPRAT